MLETGTSGLMSGAGKRGGVSASVLAPGLDSTAFWQTRFNGDPAIIGRPLHISGRLIRVIGVLPAAFHPMHMSNPGEIPQVFRAFEIEELESEDRREGSTAIARLRPGLTAGQARAELNTITRNLVREHPADYPSDVALIVQPLDEKLTGSVRTILWVLLGAVGFVLLITCANVANLLLIQASARDTEMAVRAALGCRRWRLVRQVLTESLVLSILGGLAGVLLAWAATAALVALAPTEIPRADEIRMDSSILIFAVVISIITGALFGSAPALKAARLSLNEVLRGSRDPSGGRSARGVRHGLVIAEIASAFVLAIGAGLLGRSLNQLLLVHAGYDPHHLLTMTIFVYDGTPEKELQHYQRIVERVRNIPGVRDAAMVSTLPLSSPQQSSVYVEGRPLPNDAEAPVIDSYFASPDYFRVMRIPLRRGRFSPTRTYRTYLRLRSSANPAHVRNSRTRIRSASELASATAATGRPSLGSLATCGNTEWTKGRARVCTARRRSMWIFTIGCWSGRRATPGTSTRRSARPCVNSTQTSPCSMSNRWTTMSLNRWPTAFSRFRLSGCSACLPWRSPRLAFMAWSRNTVSLRTHEFGIRIALGAGRVAVLGLVMRDLLAVLGSGLGIGLLAALLLTRFLAHLLYGVHTSDWVTTLTAALTLACVALAAALVPCRRAIRVNPSTALRHT